MMTCEKARKLCGEDMFYLADPYVNLDVLDLYQKDTGAAWLLVAKFMYNFTTSHNPKILAHVKKIGNASYYWISYDIVISRLWHYGIRSRSTVCNAFASLCEPKGGLPPLLLKHSEINTYGRPMVYYTPTEMFDNLFVQHPSSIVKQNQDRMLTGESSDVSDEISETEEELPKSPDKPIEPFTFPDWWDHFWEEVSATGKYKDKIYKDKEPTVVNGYVQDTVETITSILNNTYYNEGSYGEHHDVKYDLSNVTIESIIDALKKYNIQEPVTMKEVVCPFPGRGKNSKKSRFMSLLCVGTEWPKDNVPAKPAKFIIKEESYEPSKKEGEEGDRSPSSIWFGENNGFNERPDKYYPELTLNHPRVWGLYHAIKDYAASCKSPEGIWTKHNKPGTTVSDIDILYWVLRVASEHGCTSDDIFQNIIIGDDSNYLWALVIQYAFNNNRYKLARDEKKSSYLYCGAKDLNHSMYTKVVGKGVKK